MLAAKHTDWGLALALSLFALVVGTATAPAQLVAQMSDGQHETTFTEDIAPIL